MIGYHNFHEVQKQSVSSVFWSFSLIAQLKKNGRLEHGLVRNTFPKLKKKIYSTRNKTGFAKKVVSKFRKSKS